MESYLTTLGIAAVFFGVVFTILSFACMLFVTAWLMKRQSEQGAAFNSLVEKFYSSELQRAREELERTADGAEKERRRLLEELERSKEVKPGTYHESVDPITGNKVLINEDDMTAHLRVMFPSHFRQNGDPIDDLLAEVGK